MKIKRVIYLIISILILISCENANSIKSVNIGNQTWMSDNLNVDFFKNGDKIEEVKNDDDWKKAILEKKPAWCYYKNDINNGKKFGKIYNWYAIIDERGLAPDGWRIPNNEDWLELSNYLGGEKIAGTKLKSTYGWKNQGNGSNESGFNALPGGYRFSNGTFNKIEKYIYWWSISKPKKENDYWIAYVRFNESDFNIEDFGEGCYVRCIKN